MDENTRCDVLNLPKNSMQIIKMNNINKSNFYLSMEVGQRKLMRSRLRVAQGEGRLLVQGPSQGIPHGPFAAEGHLREGLAHVEG